MKRSKASQLIAEAIRDGKKQHQWVCGWHKRWTMEAEGWELYSGFYLKFIGGFWYTLEMGTGKTIKFANADGEVI